MDRRTPFDVFDEMDQLFDQMRRSMVGMRPSFPEMRPVPGFGDHETAGDTNLTLEPTDDGYVVLADLPGFEKEEIDLRFDEGVLSIRATHEVSEEAMGASFSRSRRVSDSIRVPGDVVVEDIDARYRNGVLEVTIPVEGEIEDDRHRIDID
jgi:HSP20 family protein